MSDDWTSSLSHNFQRIEANGFNDYDPAVGDLETIKFYDEFRTDEWLSLIHISEPTRPY